MSYCIKCGKGNTDTAKFCTGCGTMLQNSAGLTAPANKQSTVEYPGDNSEAISANRRKWVVICIITLAALGAGAYFIFFARKERDAAAESPVPTNISPVIDTVIIPAATPIDSLAEAIMPAPFTTSKAAAVDTVSQMEVNTVLEQLRNFYQCENDEDIPCLLRHYHFPVDRYYQLNNVAYDDLHKLFTESFAEKLVYHQIAIKWDYCTVTYGGKGYKIILYADYQFRIRSSPDEARSRSIQIIIYMGIDYLITGIHEN